MKYKCTNCGQIYSIKTDYCDCGNNVFDEILEEKDIQEQKYQQKNYREEEESSDLYDNTEEDDKNKNKNIANILAVISFFTAIIISSILLFKACSLPAKNNHNISKETTKIETDIPQVDAFWDNTPVKEPETKTVPQQVKKEEKKTTTDIAPQQQISVKTKPNVTPQTNNKPKTTTNNNSQTNKPVKQKQEVKQNNAVQAKQDADRKRAEEQQKKIEQEKKNLEEQKRKIEEEKQKLQEQKQKEEQQRQANRQKEINSYKNTIRSTLFANFPILTVSGYGSAQIAFSVSSDGKILNRRFVSQSDNKSLNDAMYHMLMRTPSVQRPPESYAGEEFILKMDFNNGSYSFSYVK